MKTVGLGVFVFRRDLRLKDNTGLNEALRRSKKVLPVFVVDPRQFSEANRYRGWPALQFLIESLEDLDRALRKQGSRLHLLQGVAEEVLPTFMKKEGAEALFVNRDYTPFSRARDERLGRALALDDRSFFGFDDALLTNPDAVVNGSQKPYLVFSAYYRAASQMTIPSPAPVTSGELITSRGKRLTVDRLRKELPEARSYFRTGGRKEGLKILKRLEALDHYKEERDFPSIEGTSGLSAHHKFGTISIRETYHRAKEAKLGETFLKELYWRDFSTMIAWHYPHVFKGSFHKEYDRIEWNTSRRDFRRFTRGMTGFPIVDAGIRQLLETGFMHNRVRMIVASFLVKDLHLSWREGERFFAQHLLDYDPAVNNGNWQWVAGTGVDAQPYFRVFNPWLQSKKFDADARYIKRYIPQLKNVPASAIHAWDKCAETYPETGYPSPMVEHKMQAEEIKRRFSKARARG